MSLSTRGALPFWYSWWIMIALFAFFLMATEPGRAEADALFNAGRYQQAAKSYLTLLSKSEGDAALLDSLGQSLLETGQPRAAISFFQREVALNPNDRNALRFLATALQEANLTDDAERLLTQLTVSDPADAESWYLLAQVRYRNGYYSAAIDDFDRALSVGLDGGRRHYKARAEITRAISLLEAGRAAEAEKALPQLLLRPENAVNLDLLLAYARLLYEEGNYGEAMREAEIATAANPMNASAWFWRARILQAQGQIPGAVADAERSRDLAPDSPAPRSLLIRLYQKTGRTADAAREAIWLREREAQAAAP